MHEPIDAKGVGESATVGVSPAIANADVDALWHLGLRNIDIPITPPKVGQVLKGKKIVVEQGKSKLLSSERKKLEMEINLRFGNRSIVRSRIYLTKESK